MSTHEAALFLLRGYYIYTSSDVFTLVQSKGEEEPSNKGGFIFKTTERSRWIFFSDHLRLMSFFFLALRASGIGRFLKFKFEAICYREEEGVSNWLQNCIREKIRNSLILRWSNFKTFSKIRSPLATANFQLLCEYAVLSSTLSTCSFSSILWPIRRGFVTHPLTYSYPKTFYCGRQNLKKPLSSRIVKIRLRLSAQLLRT